MGRSLGDDWEEVRSGGTFGPTFGDVDAYPNVLNRKGDVRVLIDLVNEIEEFGAIKDFIIVLLDYRVAQGDARVQMSACWKLLEQFIDVVGPMQVSKSLYKSPSRNISFSSCPPDMDDDSTFYFDDSSW